MSYSIASGLFHSYRNNSPVLQRLWNKSLPVLKTKYVFLSSPEKYKTKTWFWNKVENILNLETSRNFKCEHKQITATNTQLNAHASVTLSKFFQQQHPSHTTFSAQFEVLFFYHCECCYEYNVSNEEANVCANSC